MARRDRQPSSFGGNPGPLIVGGLAALVLTAAIGLWLTRAVDAALTGSTRPPQPFAYLFGLLSGTQPAPGAAGIIVMAAGLVILAAIVTGVAIAFTKGLRGRQKIDKSARLLADRRDLAEYTPQAQTAATNRLRPSLAGAATAADAGPLIGVTVAGAIPIRQGLERCKVDIWGPRRGKSTTQVIPAVIEAPGACIVTSNKPDVLAATRELRERKGKTWIFDIQGRAGEPQTFWWNPLRNVVNYATAAQLMGQFVAAQGANVQRDSYFDNAAESLVASCILAAAIYQPADVNDRPKTMTDVFLWTTQPLNDEVVEILEAGGYHVAAEAIHKLMQAPEKQRGSVYESARQKLACLVEPAVMRWVTPQPGLPEFLATEFATSTDTLYIVSKGGRGSPAPLIAGIVDDIFLSAENVAQRTSLQRLDPPMVAQLDEAANIVIIERLPELLSYAGSQGILVSVILQSYAQGVDAWGREAMRKMVEAANILTYGGGATDVSWLNDLAQLAGEYDQITRTVSTGPGGTNVSRAAQRRRVLEVADLAALAFGRMVMFAAGTRPALLKTVPWQKGPYAAEIQAAISRYGADRAQYDTTLYPTVDDQPTTTAGSPSTVAATSRPAMDADS